MRANTLAKVKSSTTKKCRFSFFHISWSLLSGVGWIPFSRTCQIRKTWTICLLSQCENQQSKILSLRFPDNSFQILQLCDEFVPGDPPEYFFDRWSSICLELSSYFFQESRQLPCSSQHLSVGFHIQMRCLMTIRDSDGGCIQFWFISRTFFTVGQVTSSIAILCNVEVARLKLWLLTTNRVFFLFAVKECLRGKAAFEQELNYYTQSIFTSELQEMQVVFLSPELYKAITTSALGAL